MTGGFQLGIMKLAGEAVRDYTDAYGGNRMLAFGVSSWGCVKKNDILEAALEEVCLPYNLPAVGLNCLCLATLRITALLALTVHQGEPVPNINSK